MKEDTVYYDEEKETYQSPIEERLLHNTRRNEKGLENFPTNNR